MTILPEREATPTLDDAIGEDELSLAWRLLILVGALYILEQVLLFSLRRWLGFDEAIYVAEVRPGAHAISFNAARARGITWLIAPITLLTGSITMIRAYMTVVSGLLLVTAYRVWSPLVGIVAPVAAALFGFTWVALLYGSQIYPNLPVTFFLIAATGYVARGIARGSDRAYVWAGGMLALAAFVRPTDALWLAIGAGVVVLAYRRSGWLRGLVTLGAGLIVGWIPWIIEAYARFGGPLARWRNAEGQVRSIGFHLFDYLRLADGPTCALPGKLGPIPWHAVPWWVVLGGLGVVGVVRSRRTAAFIPALTATVGAAALAFPYVLLVRIPCGRYLLPSYALLAIPAGFGIRSLWPRRGSPVRRAIAISVLLIPLLAIASWHARVADSVERGLVKQGNIALALARAMKSEAAGRPCAFASNVSFPQIELASGCDGSRLTYTRTTEINRLEARARNGERVFVVSNAAPPIGYPLARWSSKPVDIGSITGWMLYEPPANL